MEHPVGAGPVTSAYNSDNPDNTDCEWMNVTRLKIAAISIQNREPPMSHQLSSRCRHKLSHVRQHAAMRLSKQQAAARLEVSTATIERKIQRGELEAEKEPHGTATGSG